MLELENQLEAIAVPPPEPVIPGPSEEEDAASKENLELSLDPSHHSPSAWKTQPKEVGMWEIKF
jgi:hypothetical protein